MVVVLQLDQEASIDDDPLTSPRLCSGSYRSMSDMQPWRAVLKPNSSNRSDIGPSCSILARRDHVLTGLLTCYPVVMSLVSNLDLNDLDAFSRTSFQIRQRLLEFRQQILPRTLHCKHEAENQEKVRAGRWIVPCARDLVGPCRRCGIISCRNCTIKPPSNRELPRRYRRLCRACQKASLSQVARLPPACGQERVAAGSICERGPCTCESVGVYICQECHISKGSDDINYTRVWTWRSRYHSLGFGLGTGIGEGNEGVKCGRSERCLAARDIIVDMDCAEDGKAIARVDEHGIEVLEVAEAQANLTVSDGSSQRVDMVGYYRQEVEGIGGVVKKKLKKRVRVGATVVEHEDERESGAHLDRERSGMVRGWCAWCDRVIPSSIDQKAFQA